MTIDSWDDLRIALAVARSGTVSGAAEALGVHHATVIRRIDGLEAQLGVKLFQRHPRGYALTEAGQAMLKVASDADERFAQLTAQIAGGGDRIEGELVVTSLPELADVVIGPSGDGVQARAAAFVAFMEELMDRSGAPRRLRDVDVPEESLPMLARDAMLQTRLLQNNPVAVDEAAALALYRQAF